MVFHAKKAEKWRIYIVTRNPMLENNGVDAASKEPHLPPAGLFHNNFSCHAWMQRTPVLISSNFGKGMAERLTLAEPS